MEWFSLSSEGEEVAADSGREEGNRGDVTRRRLVEGMGDSGGGRAGEVDEAEVDRDEGAGDVDRTDADAGDDVSLSPLFLLPSPESLLIRFLLIGRLLGARRDTAGAEGAVVVWAAPSPLFIPSNRLSFASIMDSTISLYSSTLITA